MAARSTMADLILMVRQLAVLDETDLTPGVLGYWTDTRIQTALDQTRQDVDGLSLSPVKETDSGGTIRYLRYNSGHTYYEQTDGGTAIFYVYDATGARAGTATYTADYRRGVVTFGSDQAGTAYYLSGRVYDPYLAAAEVWEYKAANVADRFDFTADGASFKVSQLVDHYQRQASRMKAQSKTGGVMISTFYRDDVVP